MNNKINYLKNHLMLTLSLSLMLITQTAHADFRKALDAYQKRDGATMLNEVKDAVEKKKDAGLILFLSSLQLDSAIATSSFILTQNERQELYDVDASKKESLLGPPWKIILDDNSVKKLFLMLQTASNQSSLESQYRFISLRYGKEYHVIMNQFNQQTNEQINANDKKFYALIDELINKGYVNPLPYLMDEANLKHDLARASALRNKGISLGQTRLLLEQATDYLMGNKENNTNQNETKGLRLLEQALAKPDAEFYYANIASKVSGYYFKKGDMQSLHQAYLWSLVALTTSRSGLVPSSLIDLKKTGNFANIASPEIDEAWSTSIQKIKNTIATNNTDIWTLYVVYDYLPSQLKELKNLELPDLIKKGQKIDLQKHPVLSLHHFYYDAFYVKDLAPINNYLIDVYADGRINFALGNAFDRSQNTETYTRFSAKEVQKLIDELRNAGFESLPLVNNSKHAFYRGLWDVNDVYSRTDGRVSMDYITLRDKVTHKTVVLNKLEGEELPASFAKILNLFEPIARPQQYRCGHMENLEYYQECITKYRKFLEIAKQGRKYATHSNCQNRQIFNSKQS